MAERIKFIFLFLVLTNIPMGYSQTHYLPPPQAMGTTSTPPPPVGLPLPIDDYIPFLLLAGLIYGVQKIAGIKKG